MQRLDTGFEPATRLLNLVIARGISLCRHQTEDWLNGEIEMGFVYRYLGDQAGIDAKQVPTTLMYLRVGGYINALFDCNPNHARISLRLPAGAQLA